MDHEQKTTIFFFRLQYIFFKDNNWFSIPNPNFKFIPFIYTIWKNDLLKDLFLVGTTLIIEVGNDFNI